MENGRIEDLLRLAVNSEKPLLRGAGASAGHLVIPPEKKKVIDKLQLRGEFGLTKAKFTDPAVQTKLIGLSRRGQGMTTRRAGWRRALEPQGAVRRRKWHCSRFRA